MTEQTPRSANAILVCLMGLAALTAADLWTKSWAEDHLSREPSQPRLEACERNDRGYTEMQRLRTRPVVLIDDYLELRYAENCGAAFSMLNDAPRWVRAGVFFTAATLATVVLMWMFVTGAGGPLFAWSVPFVVSGALGNLIDRFRLGYVVDFIRFHLQDGFEWPTFNVADISITIGVALLLLDGMRKPKPTQEPTPDSEPSQP